MADSHRSSGCVRVAGGQLVDGPFKEEPRARGTRRHRAGLANPARLRLANLAARTLSESESPLHRWLKAL